MADCCTASSKLSQEARFVRHTCNLGWRYRCDFPVLFYFVFLLLSVCSDATEAKPDLVFSRQDAAAAIDNMVWPRIFTLAEVAFGWHRGSLCICRFAELPE